MHFTFRYISHLATGARKFCYWISFMPLSWCLFFSILLPWSRWWKLFRAVVTQLYVLVPSWPIWYDSFQKKNIIPLKISGLLSCYIWSFAKLLILFFWQRCEEINPSVLEVNWRLEICPFILALSRELKKLIQNYRLVNCIAEFLTQTTHLYYCFFYHIMLLLIKIKFVVKINHHFIAISKSFIFTAFHIHFHSYFKS